MKITSPKAKTIVDALYKKYPLDGKLYDSIHKIIEKLIILFQEKYNGSPFLPIKALITIHVEDFRYQDFFDGEKFQENRGFSEGKFELYIRLRVRPETLRVGFSFDFHPIGYVNYFDKDNISIYITSANKSSFPIHSYNLSSGDIKQLISFSLDSKLIIIGYIQYFIIEYLEIIQIDERQLLHDFELHFLRTKFFTDKWFNSLVQDSFYNKAIDLTPIIVRILIWLVKTLGFHKDILTQRENITKAILKYNDTLMGKEISSM